MNQRWYFCASLAYPVLTYGANNKYIGSTHLSVSRSVAIKLTNINRHKHSHGQAPGPLTYIQ